MRPRWSSTAVAIALFALLASLVPGAVTAQDAGGGPPAGGGGPSGGGGSPDDEDDTGDPAPADGPLAIAAASLTVAERAAAVPGDIARFAIDLAGDGQCDAETAVPGSVGLLLDLDRDPTTGLGLFGDRLGVDARIGADCLGEDGVVSSDPVVVLDAPIPVNQLVLGVPVSALSRDPAIVPYTWDDDRVYTAEGAIDHFDSQQWSQAWTRLLLVGQGVGGPAESAPAGRVEVTAGCGVEVAGPAGDPDVDDLLVLIEEALASQTFSDLLDDACTTLGGDLGVEVRRDDPRVYLGALSEADGTVSGILDLEDLLTAEAFTVGPPEVTETLPDSLIRRQVVRIAATIGAPQSPPLVPGVLWSSSVRAPAVDLGNAVEAELDGPFQVQTFREDAEGRPQVDFRLLGATITFDGLGHLRSTTGYDGDPPLLSLEGVTPEDLLAIPTRPCEDGEDLADGCWVTGEGILGGVADDDGRCGPVPNNGDLDGDGFGNACDDDIDGDGWLAALEAGLGSSDLDSQSLPEHPLRDGACDDGTDDDGDGLADGDDPGCLQPLPTFGYTFTDQRAGSQFCYLEVDEGDELGDPIDEPCLPLAAPDAGGPAFLSFTVGFSAILDVISGGGFQAFGQLTFQGITSPSGPVTDKVPLRVLGGSLEGADPDGQHIQLDIPWPGSGVLHPSSQPGMVEGEFEFTLRFTQQDGTNLYSESPVRMTTDGPTPLPPGPFFLTPEVDDLPITFQEQPSIPLYPIPLFDGDTAELAIESLELVAGPEARVLAGTGRVETAAAVAGTRLSADTVLIARADDYPDALAGGPLATALDAPILLTDSGVLPEATAEELLRLDAAHVIVLGGERAVGPEVIAAVQGLGLTVKRIAGPDRFATAAAIAGRLAAARGVEAIQRVYLAEGVDADPSRGWPDALSVSVLAAHQGRPILLTDSERLPAATAAAIETSGVTHVTVVGGPAAVSDGVANEIETSGVIVDRLAGVNRYATSVQVTRAGLDAGLGSDMMFLVTGLSFPDALVAGPAAAGVRAPLVLVDGADLDASPDAGQLLAEERPNALVFVGGESVLSDAVRQAAREATGR